MDAFRVRRWLLIGIGAIGVGSLLVFLLRGEPIYGICGALVAGLAGAVCLAGIDLIGPLSRTYTYENPDLFRCEVESVLGAVKYALQKEADTELTFRGGKPNITVRLGSQSAEIVGPSRMISWVDKRLKALEMKGSEDETAMSEIDRFVHLAQLMIPASCCIGISQTEIAYIYSSMGKKFPGLVEFYLLGICPDCGIKTKGGGLNCVVEKRMPLVGRSIGIKRLLRGVCANEACSCTDLLIFWGKTKDQAYVDSFVQRALKGPASSSAELSRVGDLVIALARQLEKKNRKVPKSEILNLVNTKLLGICPKCGVITSGETLSFLGALRNEEKKLPSEVNGGIKRLSRGYCRNEACPCTYLMIFWRPNEGNWAVDRLARMGIQL
jgi:hypothetical protein